MPKVELEHVKKIRLTIELSESEAQILRGWMQNPLFRLSECCEFCEDPGSEPALEYELRRTIFDMINKAFSARIDLQYYADRPVEKSIIDETKSYCKVFFIKTKDILARITEEQVVGIRSKFKNLSK